MMMMMIAAAVGDVYMCDLCMKAKLVQATYVSSVIQSLPQRNGVIDVSIICICYVRVPLFCLC